MVFLALCSVTLLTYRFVFTPVRVTVVSSAETLLASPGENVRASILLENRLGWQVPFSSARLRCVVIEGRGLVALRYANDSTSVSIESLGAPGSVELRVFTPASVFPLSLRLPILPPFA
jgi:hypothetical protein